MAPTSHERTRAFDQRQSSHFNSSTGPHHRWHGGVLEILIKWTVRENLRRGTQQRNRNTELIY